MRPFTSIADVVFVVFCLLLLFLHHHLHISPPEVPLKEDVADLNAGPTEDVNTTDRDGAPVGIVETSR